MFVSILVATTFTFGRTPPVVSVTVPVSVPVMVCENPDCAMAKHRQTPTVAKTNLMLIESPRWLFIVIWSSGKINDETLNATNVNSYGFEPCRQIGLDLPAREAAAQKPGTAPKKMASGIVCGSAVTLAWRREAQSPDPFPAAETHKNRPSAAR